MSVYDTHKPKTEGGGLYLKLEDGETARIRIVSEPVIFQSSFQQPDGTEKLSTRYAWLVWNVDAGVPQVLQQSATFFKNIANLAQDEDYGDPTQYDIKVRREGTGTDTIYHITASPKPYPIAQEWKDEINKLDLVELIEKSPSASRVMWLADFESGTEQTPKTGLEKARAVADSLKGGKKDEATEDIGDQPVNLDDIPF